MKMIIDINLDAIFNAVEDVDWNDAEYKILKKKEPHGNYEAIRKWKLDCDYRYNQMDKAYEAVYAIISVFDMHEEAQRRMRIALRAKQRWEKKNGYMRLPDEKMMKQFANFIFDDPKNDQYGRDNHGFVVKKRWWEFDSNVYEREVIE